MILGIGGKAGAGESTVVSYLESKGFEEIELAGNMKEFLAQELMIPLNHFYDIEEKNKERKSFCISFELVKKVNDVLFPIFNKKISIEHPIVCHSYRELLQKFGTEVLRTIDEDIHIKWGLHSSKQKENLIC